MIRYKIEAWNMHEVSIALAIVDEISERATRDGIKKITAVYLKVGKLTAVDETALKFAWDLTTDGTPASGSSLCIEHVPLTIYCKQCGCERIIIEGALPVCPDCATPSNEITRGRELLITAMEVFDAAESGRYPTEHFAQE